LCLIARLLSSGYYRQAITGPYISLYMLLIRPAILISMSGSKAHGTCLYAWFHFRDQADIGQYITIYIQARR
jgi:hypothetical protein